MKLLVHVHSPAGEADYDFDGPEVVVGRSPSAGLSLVDSRVSRQHVRLSRRDDAWWVEDLGARNGTLLNGTALTAAARLQPGDEVRIGDSVLRIVAGHAPAAGDRRGAPTHVLTGRPTQRGDTERLSTLAEIHKAIAAPLPLAELLDLVLARCFDLLAPEEGAIVLRDAGGQFVTAVSRRAGGDSAPVAVPRRLLDEVAGQGRPALVLDAFLDDRFAQSNSMVASGLRSIVAVPLTDSDGTLGLMALASRAAVRQFVQADLDMLSSVAAAAALRVRNATLAEEIASRRIAEHDLALARDVQMSMLPRAAPDCDAVHVGMRLRPARSVGGDFYDFVLAGGRLWFIVADVAGKSVAAALYVAIVKTLFRAVAAGEDDLAAVARRMNRDLSQDNERLTFVTCALGCLDIACGQLSLVDAGHPPAILARPGAAAQLLTVPKAPAMGVVEDAVLDVASFELTPGSTVVLYTDGVSEARNSAGDWYGIPRVCAAVARAAAAHPAALVDAVMADVDHFTAGAAQEDDLAILALRWAPSS